VILLPSTHPNQKGKGCLSSLHLISIFLNLSLLSIPAAMTLVHNSVTFCLNNCHISWLISIFAYFPDRLVYLRWKSKQQEKIQDPYCGTKILSALTSISFSNLSTQCLLHSSKMELLAAPRTYCCSWCLHAGPCVSNALPISSSFALSIIYLDSIQALKLIRGNFL
jgi:hypothetical protein